MAIDSCVCTSREVFLDLSGPVHFDDYEDAVYPYSPPSIDETIQRLAQSPPQSFDTLILSVPTLSRSSPEISKTLATLADFALSPACAGPKSLRICGSLSLLNHKKLHDALKALHLRELILQEPRALHDSYALAALLSSAVGMDTLHLAVTAQDVVNIHPSFNEEVKETFALLKTLHLSCIGETGQTISKVFNTGSIKALEALDVCYQGCSSPQNILAAIFSAASTPGRKLQDRLLVTLR